MSKYGVFSGPYFPAFRLNTPYLSAFSQNVGKYRPEKNSVWTLFKQWILSEYKQLIRWTLILICVICPHLFFPQNFTINAEVATGGVPLKKPTVSVYATAVTKFDTIMAFTVSE